MDPALSGKNIHGDINYNEKSLQILQSIVILAQCLQLFCHGKYPKKHFNF